MKVFNVKATRKMIGIEKGDVLKATFWDKEKNDITTKETDSIIILDFDKVYSLRFFEVEQTIGLDVEFAFEVLTDFEKEAREYKRKAPEQIRELDVQVSDILHNIELEELTDEQKIAMVDELKENRDKRRVLKDTCMLYDIFIKQIFDTMEYKNTRNKIGGAIKQVESSMEGLSKRKYAQRSRNVWYRQ